MKMLIDFLPVALFFMVFKMVDNPVDEPSYSLYLATAVLIIACAVQTLGYRLWTGYFEKSHVYTLLAVAILGGLTLILHDEMFIKWKPSVINWLFALIFLGSMWVGERKPVIQRLLGGQVVLPAAVWSRLNVAWALFFIGLGALNLYVVYHYDTNTWVDFKMFGLMGLTIVFIIAQSLYMAKYIQSDTQESSENDKPSQ